MRLPLQIGTAALWSLLRASALLVPTAIVTGAAIWLVVELGIDGDAAGYVIGIPAVAFFFAIKHLRRAWQQRPSDLAFDADGFGVHGGRHDGQHFGWSELTECSMSQPAKSEDDDVAELWRVRLKSKRAPEVLLAATDDAVEKASLAEVTEAIAAGLRSRATAPKLEDAPPEVVRCPSCRAPARPSAKDDVECAFCHARVPMPKALQEKVHAAQVVARRPERVVRALLRQPRAGFVGSLYLAAAVFMLTAWPIALAVMALHVRDDTLDWAGAGFVALFLVACLLGFFGVIRGLLVDRQALRVLLLGFSARPPMKPGEPPTCRGCAAPLPEPGKQVLVTCAYCAAPNVLAVDFRSLAKEVEAERQSLERALKRRTQERWRWRAATFAGVVLIALSGWALRHGITRPPPVKAHAPGDAR